MTIDQEKDMIKLVGDHITEYYQKTRGVGHTRAMIDGIGTSSVVIVVNDQQRKELQKWQPLGLYIVLSHDLGDKLRGLRSPLHIDNHAFEVIWAEARMALDKAENKIARLESKLAKAREELR